MKDKSFCVMMCNMADEIDSAEAYIDMAMKAKEDGDKETYQNSMMTAKDELEHFKWQYDTAKNEIDGASVECLAEVVEKVCKKMYDKYESIKCKLESH